MSVFKETLEKEIKDDSNICMKAIGITKVYPGTIALDNVDFNVYKSKVNILIGENGAGKSTLMKILAGVEQLTSGILTLDGNEIQLKDTRDAVSKGIGIIHQELNLFTNLNIMQNIFMSREDTKHGFILNDTLHYEKTVKLLQKLEQSFDPRVRVGDLRVGEQQVIEIAKTMAQENLKILIMDEPTSALSSVEIKILFKLINELKKKNIAIIYISHRLEEVVEIGDYITILRDGKFIVEEMVKNIDVPWIVRNMVGHEPVSFINRKGKVKSDKEIFRGESICLRNKVGGYVVDNVSFSLKRGEILGLYGLMGAGRTELIECLMGLHPDAKGKLYLENKEIDMNSISKQIKRGFAYIPEDRQRDGIIQSLNIGDNLTFVNLKNYAKIFHLIKKDKENDINKIIKKLDIKVADSTMPINSLSGGNQQKIVIGKWILTSPRILFMDEPTRGIDVGAKEDVFKIMNKLASDGFSIIYISSDLKEIVGAADRVIVMSNGKVTGEFKGDEIQEESLVVASAAGFRE
ncbi:MAG TPA: sugar ABC transporter ATP-binding protein [Clostridium sp.]|uniref:sugar ABC transporter ATP-binding protein n=1 Tax=Clostridium sp. TaxID=1506 RepID=UPI002F9242C4